MSSVINAINTLEMSKAESEIFSVDFSDWIAENEKIIGVQSVTLAPVGSAPAITSTTYSKFGKLVSFRLDATGGSVNRGTFALSVIVTTQIPTESGYTTNTKEARGYLIVS